MQTCAGTVSVSTAKRAMRARYLKALRTWAKACPEELNTASVSLCDKLCSYTQQTFWSRDTMTDDTMRGPSPLYVCAYLPLYFEVDLLPYIHSLWASRGSSSSSAPSSNILKTEDVRNASNVGAQDICIMVPVVLAPPPCKGNAQQPCYPPRRPWYEPCEDMSERLRSAMMFVEVLSAEDLDMSFEMQLPYNIVEPKEHVLSSFFILHRESNTSDGDSVGDGVLGSHSGAKGLLEEDTQVLPQCQRRLIVCDEWESLFPLHKKPAGLVDIRAELAHTAKLLVLAPGVAFSTSNGARLGKGGGFYDRFLKYVHTIRDFSIEERRGSDDAVTVVGVGFDNQIVGPDAEEPIHMESCDGAVEAVATPSAGVVRVMC